MFSGNIFVGTLNIDIVIPSMKEKKKKKKIKKKNYLLQKSIGGWHDSDSQ